MPTPILQMGPLMAQKREDTCSWPPRGAYNPDCPHSPSCLPPRHPEPWGGVPALTQAMTEDRKMVLGTAAPAV